MISGKDFAKVKTRLKNWVFIASPIAAAYSVNGIDTESKSFGSTGQGTVAQALIGETPLGSVLGSAKAGQIASSRVTVIQVSTVRSASDAFCFKK